MPGRNQASSTTEEEERAGGFHRRRLFRNGAQCSECLKRTKSCATHTEIAAKKEEACLGKAGRTLEELMTQMVEDTSINRSVPSPARLICSLSEKRERGRCGPPQPPPRHEICTSSPSLRRPRLPRNQYFKVNSPGHKLLTNHICLLCCFSFSLLFLC